MKFLVLGATGMAGHMVAMYLCEKKHDVTAFSRGAFPYCKNLNGDITDIPYLSETIRSGEYDVVVNCIGLLNQDCEVKKSQAVYLNSYLPHFLAEITQSTQTRIIHLSTDCVFSGKSGGYNEDSFCDGQSFYDRSKALGEIMDEKNLTFRTSIIGPDMKEGGIGLLNWFMKQENDVYGYKQAIWTGVTTLTLAKAMEAAALENLTGLYHLVNNQSISKYDLLRLFNSHLRDNAVQVLPDEKVKIDKSLINNRKDFSFIVPSYEDMVIEIKEWMKAHKNLYPHYF